MAKDLGKIQSTTSSVVYALGLARDTGVKLDPAPGGGTEIRHPYYTTRYTSAGDGVNLDGQHHAADSELIICNAFR